TLKGGAGAVDFRAILEIAHRCENILDKVRGNKLKLNSDMVDVLFECLDILKKCCSDFKTQNVVKVEISGVIKKLDDIIENKNIEENKTKTEKIKSIEQEKKIMEEVNVLMKVEEKDTNDFIEKEKKLTDSGSASSVSAKTAQSGEEKKSLRVEAEKLDTLMNMAGELVISRIMIENGFQNLKMFYSELNEINSQFTDTANFDKIMDIINHFNKTFRGFGELINKIELANTGLGRLTSNIQQAILKTRLVPLSSVFNRYNRLVRDLSKTLNKKIDLIIEGAETEVDKVIVEVIGDPLVHLLRNSIDHGLEEPVVRKQKGKPETGMINLKAYYEGEQVVIEVSDDGRGLDIDKIKNKAIEKGLITKSQADEMSKQEAQKLIFKAGFSTAASVTSVSGRGVGMDVVQDVVTKLKGRIEVFSEIDQGTTIKLRLPLTMAIIKILTVKVGDDIIAIPLSAIKETIALKMENIRYVSGKEVFNLRGEVVPIIRLGIALNSPNYDEYRDTFFAVIVGLGAEEVGLIVDDLVHQQEVVIKNLGSLLKKVKYVSGATITGDGGVCLILDIEQILGSQKMYESSRTLKIGKAKHTETEKTPQKKLDDNATKNIKKVLVVDDSKPIRNMLKSYVEEAGYAVDEAANAEEALQLLKDNMYSLITVDVLMPGLNGYELSAKIREMKKFLKTPIVMISALTDKVDKIKGFDAGIDEYLTKPVD
ncbi:MAG TPA: chemotaxis protein CheW, partial [bacterium]|nr:chemotaxis protein CheW [bacterium]